MTTRAWYRRQFDHIEAGVTAFAGQVRALAGSGRLTPDGLAASGADLQAAAHDDGQAVVQIVEAQIAADRETIEAALTAPPPVPAAADAAMLLYAQNLAVLRYNGPNARDRTQIFGDLERAIEAGDAITARVLADALPSLVVLSGPSDYVTAERITALQKRAARLSATPELAAALALAEVLDGDTADIAVGVQAKADFVRVGLGARLSLIVQRAGVDPLARVFELDYPLPPGFASRVGVGVTPSYLAQSFGQWFTV